jgi:hypothetical protein
VPAGDEAERCGIETAGTFAQPVNLVSTRPSDGLDENSKPEAWFANGETGMSTVGATTHAICVEGEDFKPRYYEESFVADNAGQDTGTEVCGAGKRVVGLGGATNATATALVSIFGIDTADNDLKLDDGATVTVDNFNPSIDIFPEAYAVCAA